MKRRTPGVLRIVGGTWRSRRIAFDPAAPVRPTPDRVRQTLFDWLAPMVEGTRCLDLFAGSGALGFEALSRGAAHVTFVEHDVTQASALRQSAQALAAGDRATLVVADALTWLRDTGEHFDLAFLDPPYGSALLSQGLNLLPARLCAFNRVYLEWAHGSGPTLPAGCSLLKEKRAGRVSYGLATYTAAERETP